MKKIITKLFKSLAIHLTAFFIIIGGVAFAVSFPTNTPDGQTVGGKFMQYFNNTKGTSECPDGEFIVGFDNDFKKICKKIIATVPTFTCGDTVSVGGYTYNTKIALDGKCWTSTNMKHPPTTGNSRCYDNNTSNCNTYGRLYDWNAATHSSVCGALGTGWALPTDAQWTNLINSGATGWVGNKIDGLASSRPGYFGTSFNLKDSNFFYWTNTQSDINNSYRYDLNSTSTSLDRGDTNKNYGFSVICINLNITLPVNGACGSSNGTATTTAPTTNLCSSGNGTSVATNTSNFTWSCNGINGGTNATNCSSPRQYTITFNSNGGGTPSQASKNVTYNKSIGTLPTVSRSGYKFNGWYLATSGGTVRTTATSVTANDIWYAQWTQIVNGACGTGNNKSRVIQPTESAQRCSSGTFSEVTDSTTEYKWSCIGTSGGTTASCNSTILKNPTVGTITPDRTAIRWTWVSGGGTATKYYRWSATSNSWVDIGNKTYVQDIYLTCNTLYSNKWITACDDLGYCKDVIGLPPTSTSTCSINGVCGTANGTTLSTEPTSNLCTSGTKTSVTTKSETTQMYNGGPWTTSSYYIWSCNGISGGTNDSCSANISSNVSGCYHPTRGTTEPTGWSYVRTFTYYTPTGDSLSVIKERYMRDLYQYGWTYTDGPGILDIKVTCNR